MCGVWCVRGVMQTNKAKCSKYYNIKKQQLEQLQQELTAVSNQLEQKQNELGQQQQLVQQLQSTVTQQQAHIQGQTTTIDELSVQLQTAKTQEEELRYNLQMCKNKNKQLQHQIKQQLHEANDYVPEDTNEMEIDTLDYQPVSQHDKDTPSKRGPKTPMICGGINTACNPHFSNQVEALGLPNNCKLTITTEKGTMDFKLSAHECTGHSKNGTCAACQKIEYNIHRPLKKQKKQTTVQAPTTITTTATTQTPSTIIFPTKQHIQYLEEELTGMSSKQHKALSLLVFFNLLTFYHMSEHAADNPITQWKVAEQTAEIVGCCTSSIIRWSLQFQ